MTQTPETSPLHVYILVIMSDKRGLIDKEKATEPWRIVAGIIPFVLENLVLSTTTSKHHHDSPQCGPQTGGSVSE